MPPLAQPTALHDCDYTPFLTQPWSVAHLKNTRHPVFCLAVVNCLLLLSSRRHASGGPVPHLAERAETIRCARWAGATVRVDV